MTKLDWTLQLVLARKDTTARWDQRVQRKLFAHLEVTVLYKLLRRHCVWRVHTRIPRESGTSATAWIAQQVGICFHVNLSWTFLWKTNLIPIMRLLPTSRNCFAGSGEYVQGLSYNFLLKLMVQTNAPIKYRNFKKIQKHFFSESSYF